MVTTLQRMDRSEEIVRTVLFLASDDASFITGTELVAYGGYLAYATK
ncbi:SDR family oxidoreductase [Spirosoma agri]|nr:SDR family oxidoreductase [Spirosoma agri]